MSAAVDNPEDRKPRADALKNRQKLLDVARAAFQEFGGDASLDEIAKRAGVGPGTLYRHFPTRRDLLIGVYQDSAGRLAVAAETFATTETPLEALRLWMRLFIDYVAEKQLIASAINAFFADPKALYATMRGQIWGSLERLVERAKASGDLVPGIDPADLMRALVGLAHTSDMADWQNGARRLIDLLIEGASVRA